MIQNKLIIELANKIVYSEQPSDYLIWLRKVGYIGYFKELNSLIGIPQEPEWHPEGDVWVHTLMVIDQAAKIKCEINDEFEKIVFLFSALCHDFGKPYTTYYERGRWRSPMHDSLGKAPARSFLNQLNIDDEIIELVEKYVQEHLVPTHLYKNKVQVPLSAIERLSKRINITMLEKVGRADHFGRTADEAIQRIYPAGEWLLNKYEALKNRDLSPEPFLNGKILINLNLKPSKFYGFLIKESLRLQLEGKINSESEAIIWAKKKLGNKK